MQSGYGGGGVGGGVSEIQQFMVETIGGGGGGASLFPIAAGAAPPTSAALADLHSHHHHPHHRPYHLHHPQHSHPAPPPPQFQHFHSHIPITQQLFHPQFQLYHHQHHQQQEEQQRRRRQQQLGLDCQDSGPENSSSPTVPMIGGGGRGGNAGAPPSFLAAAMNSKLAVNESSGVAEDDSILGGNADAEEESSIKEPFWRPLDLDFINNGSERSGGKEKPPESPHKYFKRMKEGGEHEQGNNGGTNYKLYSELEAIYRPGGSGSGCGGGGSGSALTGETPVANEPLPVAAAASDQHQVPSDTSTGALEAAAGAVAKNKKFKRKKRRRHDTLRSVAAFFEALVKQLMDHQENLHKKFLEAAEKRDGERAAREESWQQEQAANASREAAARARDRSVAAAREAAIISLLETLTGETLVLPPNLENKTAPRTVDDNTTIDSGGAGRAAAAMNSSRWPKAEVQALIRVRSVLEVRFQEPGLKGPLWEEVSSAMAAMGYKRSPKRCKEKWENINKYFRKTKDSGKRRPRNSKTCPYFHELDQLYAGKSSGSPAVGGVVRKDNSELLDAIVESSDHPSTTTATNTTRFSNGEGEDEDDDNESDDEDERLHGKKKLRGEVGGGDSDDSSIFQRHA